jgi:CheY-like chemotaxis protein
MVVAIQIATMNKPIDAIFCDLVDIGCKKSNNERAASETRYRRLFESAKDGHEALMLFMRAEESGKPFIASILDLTVRGGMGGRDTLTAIRKINAESIVIASSGYSEDPIMSKPTDFGFTDSIVKPFRGNDLMELFERLFASERTV